MIQLIPLFVAILAYGAFCFALGYMSGIKEGWREIDKLNHRR